MRPFIQPRAKLFKIIQYTRSDKHSLEEFREGFGSILVIEALKEERYPPGSYVVVDGHMKWLGYDRFEIYYKEKSYETRDIYFVVDPSEIWPYSE